MSPHVRPSALLRFDVLAHLLSFTAMILAVGVSYGDANTRLKAVETEQTLRRQDAERLARVEEQGKQLKESVQDVRAGIARIEQRLDVAIANASQKEGKR